MVATERLNKYNKIASYDYLISRPITKFHVSKVSD